MPYPLTLNLNLTLTLTLTLALALTLTLTRYAADTVAAENATLVTVRPPSFDAAEWERLGVELGEAGTADEYIAVPPGGSAEVLVPAQRQRMDTVQRQP